MAWAGINRSQCAPHYHGGTHQHHLKSGSTHRRAGKEEVSLGASPNPREYDMRTQVLFVLSGCLFFSVSCGRSPQSYLEKGNNFFTAGKYDEAALNYRKAVGKDARFGEAYYRLGLTALKLKDPGEAYKALSSAAEILPQRADIEVSLADLLLPSSLADN